METAVEALLARDGVELDFRETVDVVSFVFAWKPNPVARVVIKGLARFMRPLEQGSYDGKRITGEPNRASWVIASPLNIFIMQRASYWQKIVLAARLRHAGEINVVEVGPAGGKSGNRSAKSLKNFERQTRSDEKGPDRLEELIRIQRKSDVSLTVVPVARTSHQLTPNSASASAVIRAYRILPQNIIRKAFSCAHMLRTGRVKNCRPFVLSKWCESRDGLELSEQSAILRRELMGNIESQQRACAGPPAVPTREAKRRVLADPVLASYMQEYALDRCATREAVLDEAQSYVDEIASDYRVGVVRWFARAVDILFDRFLTDLEVDRAGIQFLSECDSRSRLILICSHKSYVDPLLIGYALFHSGMVPPHQAAGRNLDFWPVGWLLRHSGAFYMRRTFAGETLYTEVFSAYVRYLLAENYITVIYIEGTRSRDGKLAKPKTGLLEIFADSMKMGICQEIKLVPTYLGYEKVPEENAHVKEMAGGKKVSESVKGLGRIYKSMNTKLGRAYVKFGPPLSMKPTVDTAELEAAALAACESINNVTPITARSLAASSILATTTTWVSVAEARGAARTLLDFARSRGCPMAVDADMDGVIAAIDWFASEGHVSRDSRDGEDGLSVDGNGRRFLEYNKNIPLNHFLDASLDAIASRGCEPRAQHENLAFLRDLLDEEFVFGAAEERSTALLDESVDEKRVIASLLESYVEGYTVAARAAGMICDGSISRDDFVERCFAEGELMLSEGAITRQEAVSKTMMMNAARRFVVLGALEQRREKAKGHRDRVLLSKGPRFDEIALIEERLHQL